MVAGACLGDETIAALLEGRLADAAARGVRGHIAGCDACRRMVSAAIDNAGPVGSVTQPGHAVAGAIGPGTVVGGKYRLERMIGEGGMGQVFAARQLGLERPVAIKVLRPELACDAIALQRFQREARLIASLDSDHVVRIYDLGELPGGTPFLVMELLDGEDLAAVLARGPVGLAAACAWLLAACDVIAQAHALGMVHRDIKPSNLFLTRMQRIKVLDFGLAKLVRVHGMPVESMTRAGVMLGSPRYMAPEQIVGAQHVDARADVWSLGATLYHLVTGRPPFADEALEGVFAKILGGELPPLDGVPAPLASVIRRALARDPAARFASAAELAIALRAAAPSEGAGAAPRRISRAMLVIGGVVIAGGIATVAFLAGRSGSASRAPGDEVAAAGRDGTPRMAEGVEGSSAPAGDGSDLDGSGRVGANGDGAGPAGANRDGAGPAGANHDGSGRGDGAGPGGAKRDGAGPGGAGRDGAGPGGAKRDGAGPGGSNPDTTGAHGGSGGGSGDPWNQSGAAHAPAGSGGGGPLGNLDESRLRARLGKLGWTVTETERQTFPGCNYTRMQTKHDKAWADFALFECATREDAAWQGDRLRRGMPQQWTVDDGKLVLQVGGNSDGGFPDEKFSKQMLEAVTRP